MHCDLLTSGHLTSEAYHGVLFYNVNFAKFFVSSSALHHFMCIRCAKLMDVQLWLKGNASLPLVWNKCCLNYKISWILATSGLLQVSECTKFVFAGPVPCYRGAHDAPKTQKTTAPWAHTAIGPVISIVQAPPIPLSSCYYIIHPHCHYTIYTIQSWHTVAKW